MPYSNTPRRSAARFVRFFYTALCTAFFLSKCRYAVSFFEFDIVSFVFCCTSAVRFLNRTEKITICGYFLEVLLYGNYNQFSGATRVLLTYTSKCKWLPVLSPVLPTAAIVCPWVTV